MTVDNNVYSLQKPGTYYPLTINSMEDNERLITMHADGTIEIHHEGRVPEAARLFWDAVTSLAAQMGVPCLGCGGRVLDKNAQGS